MVKLTLKDKIKLKTAKTTIQYINRLLGLELKYKRRINGEEVLKRYVQNAIKIKLMYTMALI